MSLYYVQKLLYQLNRDPRVRERFEDDPESVLDEYELTDWGRSPSPISACCTCSGSTASS